ncbi:MAG: hybrid sensor histidine kinase/response regulator [Campylobacterota bacterium]|nr:hybrid sensor histidine kinase/response regulator [Campylobacterota bacterium]
MDKNKETILVVDDCPENIKIILEILKNDYLLIVANSGKKALEILDHKKPDLILLDILMPHIDGFKVCRIIKNNKELENIPVIFLTVLEDTKDVVKGLNLGAVDYVSKPVEPTILRARIETNLKLKHFQDQLIDDIKEKEDILIQQSKLAVLGEMFENITHQMKQPLTVASLSSANIRLEKVFGTLDDKILFHSLEDIERSIKHLGQTIDDFRDFLQDDIKKQYFNIKEIVAITLKLLDSKFKNGDIITKNDVDDIEIFTRKNDLIQVLMNILSNAEDVLKNIEGDRNIHIITDIQNDLLTLKIKDNGGGIKDEVIDTIFDKYITTKEDNKGTGLGLYMSKNIIEKRLDGNIKSYNENGGACFEISFPIE